MKLGIGDDAVTVTIDYSYSPPDGKAFDAFNEKVTLLILEGMARDGIRLAPGAST